MAYLVSTKVLPRYARRYARVFSWRRLCNFLAVLASMGFSQVLRRPIVWGRPFMLMVEPTNFCNLKCPLCPSGNGQMLRPRGNMELDDFKRLVDQLGDEVFMMMMWNQGEPYINKCFNQMVRHAHDRGIFTFTSTNGHFIRSDEQAQAIVESGLDEIIVSLDGVDQQTYAKYRVGGHIEWVFDGVRRLVKAREFLGVQTPLINLQFIVMKHNERDLAEAELLAKGLKVDKFLVKTAQVYSSADAEEFLPEEEQYRRYERQEEELVVKGQPARGCKVLWYSSMINWNGAVAPCCFDKDVDFAMGQAFNDHSFDEIWRGRAYMDFRQQLLADRNGVDMCRNCSEGYRGMFTLVKEIRG
ncbi:MAG: radical SAM protein [Candidatus Latescibacterota bacterium]|nr:radical SAM protein [Candidatus Latescibacterota bacterium]